MADTFKITVVKNFTYRGKPEEWSNSYHFTAEPANNSEFIDHVDDLIAMEKTCYSGTTEVVRAYGYDFGATSATYVRDLSTAPVVGTLNPTDGDPQRLPGDCAATVRWGTAAFTSRGKRIYLRKYFHDAFTNGDAPQDSLHAEQKAAIETFAVNMSGVDPIGIGPYVSPSGEGIIGHKVNDFVTIRQLKRRGRRPLTGP